MTAEIQAGAEYDAMGERVEITNEQDGRLCIYHPEREPVEGSAYTVWRPRESVEAVAAREEWDRLDAPESDDERADHDWNGTPRCPLCSRFMQQGIDGEGMPAAQCSRQDCNGFLEMYELEERGYIN
jgi:hypothetical protein